MVALRIAQGLCPRDIIENMPGLEAFGQIFSLSLKMFAQLASFGVGGSEAHPPMVLGPRSIPQAGRQGGRGCPPPAARNRTTSSKLFHRNAASRSDRLHPDGKAGAGFEPATFGLAALPGIPVDSVPDSINVHLHGLMRRVDLSVASQDRQVPKRSGDGGGVRRECLAHALRAARGRPVAVRGGPGPRGIIVASPANHTPPSGKRRR